SAQSTSLCSADISLHEVFLPAAPLTRLPYPQLEVMLHGYPQLFPAACSSIGFLGHWKAPDRKEVLPIDRFHDRTKHTPCRNKPHCPGRYATAKHQPVC